RRVRRPRHPRPASRLSSATHPLDSRCGRNARRTRPRSAHGKRSPHAARAAARSQRQHETLWSSSVRRIDPHAIKAHADRRVRSEYDYALFEYFRSAKVLAWLDQCGVALRGQVLDAGCGGGGMPLSLAEETARVVGIDLVDRFRDAGTRLAAEKGLHN